MPGINSFRQVDEKHVSFEVDQMLWSPKMDLIAVASVTGEVALHRLSWQKVWNLPAPSETSKVAALAWRPDGKVLAVGYSTGKINLCDVENASCLQSMQLSSSVTCLIWSPDISVGSSTLEDDKSCYQDSSDHYLPKLPPFSKSYTDASKDHREVPAEDAKKLQGQTNLNILLAGGDNGQMTMFAYGIVQLGQIDLTLLGIDCIGKIVSAQLLDDFSALSVVVETSNSDTAAGLHFLAFDCSLFASRFRELHVLSLKLGHILTLLSYMKTAISQMSEAWEDILLEMDSKLKTLAEEKYKVCGGSLSTDFLRLLMFGRPSDELRYFLLHTLTDKGLKKLGHSVETSYTNIQKLLLKHLQSVGQSLVYHISDVKGMSHWHDKFGDVGLSLEAAQHAVNMAGSFMLKSSELQQVIDASLKNFKAFFRWLYVTIMKLADEPVPSTLTKMSQQDLNFVAQFLRDNFTEDVTKDKSGFKLEKVGQYLKKQNLNKTVDCSSNPWNKFLASNLQVRNSPLLFTSYPESSLVQVFDKLTTSVDDVIQQMAETISASIKCISCVRLSTQSIATPFKTKISQRNTGLPGNRCIQTSFALINDKQPEQFYICRQPVTSNSRDFELATLKCCRLSATAATEDSDECQNHTVLDLSFYDDKTLSLLLQEADKGCRPSLVLLPVAILEPDETNSFSSYSQQYICLDDVRNVVDIASVVDSIGFRTLDNMKASKFSISGARKVACVLFASRRRVRLFLLDVEDEEEEDQQDTNHVDNMKDLTTGTDDSFIAAHVETDDENKENSSDMTDQ